MDKKLHGCVLSIKNDGDNRVSRQLRVVLGGDFKCFVLAKVCMCAEAKGLTSNHCALRIANQNKLSVGTGSEAIVDMLDQVSCSDGRTCCKVGVRCPKLSGVDRVRPRALKAAELTSIDNFISCRLAADRVDDTVDSGGITVRGKL